MTDTPSTINAEELRKLRLADLQSRVPPLSDRQREVIRAALRKSTYRPGQDRA